jgi:hypothetical protein
MERNVKIFLAAIVILIVIVPIGLLATGTAYGEWGPEDFQQMVGYVPAGLSQLADLWHAPLQDYDMGSHDTPAAQAPGYWVSAILGVGLSLGAMYILGKAIVRRSD